MIVLIVFVILGLLATHIVVDARQEGSDSPSDLLRRRRHHPRSAIDAFRRKSVIRVTLAGVAAWVVTTASADQWMTPGVAIWAGGAIVAATVAGIVWASQRSLPTYTEDEVDAALRRLLEESRYDR